VTKNVVAETSMSVSLLEGDITQLEYDIEALGNRK